jgi:two-component system nitrogen regulation sensor histidine kinase NtrY
VIIFAATWCGIYLSKGITVPIQKLAEGTHQVALGNWDYKIEAGGDDEIGVLMNSFNQMTGDLKQIKLELERRGKVVQTLMANIAAGVVSIDPSGKVTTWNKAAEQLLGVAAERALGKSYAEVFRAEPLRGIREIVDSVKGGESIEREIKLSLQEQLRSVVLSAATLHDDDGSILGVMLFLEDITQIQRVQRMEAFPVRAPAVGATDAQ